MEGYVWYWLTALLWAVYTVHCTLAGCPDDYQLHVGICYKAFDQRKTFLKASEECSNDGGTLAMPKDSNTNAFLISLKNAVDSTGEFWFGLVDQHEEGAWEWIDGTPIGSYRAWSPGESNNQDDEDCAEYSSNSWNGEECSEERRFICQIILAGCPDDYIYHEPSRVCYRAFNNKKNYADAAAACSSDGGTLAMPRNTATNNFLIYLKNAVDDSAGFRFGLTELHEEGTWIWTDGVSLGSFNAWGPYEPNNYGYQDEDCAEYFPGNAGNSRKNKWNDGQCSSTDRKFICQVIPTGCPGGYVYHEPSRVCYMAFNDKNNYADAAAACSSDGGTLAMPRNTVINNFLIYLKNAVDNSAWFRFGLTDLHEEGTWIWTDGVTLGSFSAWGPYEPNNYGYQDEDCAEYFPGNAWNSRKNKWNNGLCSTKDDSKFICQVIPAVCPDGYIYHEPSRVCYMAFNDQKNYDGAAAACSSDGGTLAMPRDTITNNFLTYLKNAVDNSAWFRFGLTDLRQEGTWMWADGVTLGTFDVWSPGEPNNHGQGEDCAEYWSRNNKWNDGPCLSNNRKFICQIIPTDDSTSAPSVGTERPSPSTGLVMEQSSSTSTIKPAVTSSIVCGGDLSGADHGSISSPGYPGNYPINRDCVWRIQVSLGNQITFAFAHFELEHHDTCAYDFVEILDGYTETDPSLGKWCSTPDTLPTPITTMGPFAYVRFHSDQSLTDSGFLMTYTAQQIGGGCGGLFTEDEGIIISPNYPNAYPHNQECIWVIRVPDTEVITLTFTNMDVEAHGNCTWDYVEVRDGGSADSPRLALLCGTAVPPPVVSTQNVMYLHFHTDASVANNGFRATYDTYQGDASTTHSVLSVGTEMPSPSTVMENPSPAATIKPEVTPNINTTSGTTSNAAQTSSRPPVLARRNVSLTLTARHPVNRSLLRDSIRQSLEKLDNGFCGDQCQIGEIFLLFATDTNGARKKRQAGDEVMINVIIQLIVLANQQQGHTSTVAAWNLLQEKAEALKQLVRSGDLTVSIDGEQVRLVDNSDNSINCLSGQGNCDEEKKTPPWLVGVICAAVVVLVIIAVVTVLLCRRKNNPSTNVPRKSGNEMKNLDTPERHGHAASEGTVDNIIYNTEDEGFVDNVIYNAGDDGTVDNIIYQGEDSKSNDQKNAPESQYESVN